MGRERVGRHRRGGRKVAAEAIQVTAVSRRSGPPSTAVDVKVDPAKLKAAIGDYGHITAVVAELPGQPGEDGLPRPIREPLHAAGQAATAPGRAAVEHYSGTHLGPSDSRRGVEISVETEAGTVAAQGPDESYSVCEEGQPGESALRPTPDP